MGSAYFPTPFSSDRSSKLPEFVGCEAGEAFFSWASARLEALDRSDPVAVNREILLLAVKYHEWYQQVPERHQTRVGKRGGHQCIFHVFMHFMDLLTEARIRVDPPVYFPAPSRPRPAFADLGTLLGLSPEEDDTSWADSEI
jgi:hypothetical protein